MDKVKILIVDDEKPAREAVRSALKTHYGSKFESWEAASIKEALDLLSKIDIDLAFLDIHLKEGTGFDFLSQLAEVDFKIIFVSGHDEYALRAFRYNATDYILKPINPIEFEEALERFDEIIPLQPGEIDKLTKDVSAEKIDKLVLKDISSIYFVKVEEIQYCKSEGNYTTFYMADESNITISKPIKKYEKILKEVNFFRPHRSFLVNLDWVRSFDKREGGTIIMDNKAEVPLARNKREAFMIRMKIG